MSEKRPWGELLQPLLEGMPRTSKPRKNGLTMVTDFGEPVISTKGYVKACGHHIDHWKLLFGTSVFLGEKALCDKLAVLKEAGILSYPGGTLLEIAALENGAAKCVEFLQRVGFGAIQVSNGNLPQPPALRKELIERAVDAGLRVISEVGSRHPHRQPPVYEMTYLARTDLELGADYVNVVSGESGEGVGIYDDNGSVKPYFLEQMVRGMDGQEDKLIWEAPLKSQQVHLIRRFGPDVNLGNIDPPRVLGLGAMRRGFRYDTIEMLIDSMIRAGEWEMLPHRRRTQANPSRLSRVDDEAE